MLHVLVDSTLRTTLLGLLVWIGLALWRPKSPALQGIAWAMVLLASLVMPALVEVGSVAWPANLVAATIPAFDASTWAIEPLSRAGPVASTLGSTHVATASGASSARAVDWALVASVIYCAGVEILLARLVVGLFLTWRIRRASVRLDESWTRGSDVRTSNVITVPVTLGSTILLPTSAIEWSAAKRTAVLAHERAHVERHDFHVHLLASVNRAIFWFNPFAWWLAACLADLAEAASDDAAIESMRGGESYAEILLDIARGARRVPAGLAMARPGLVGRRIERILAMAALPARATRRQSWLVALALLPLIALTAVAIADPVAPEPKPIALDAEILDHYVGYYEFDQAKAPNLVITISREGDHLFSQTNASPKLEIFAQSKGVFFLKGTEMRVAFQQSGDAPAIGLRILPHPDDPVGFDKGVAKRVDEAELKRAVAAVAENAAARAKPHVEVAVDPKIFDNYAGRYLLPQAVVTVTHEADYLFVQVNDQPKFRIFPESDHEFFYKALPIEVSFVTNGQGAATELILHQSGNQAIAPRVDESAAKKAEAAIAKRVADEDRPRTAVKIDSKILDDYVGKYQVAPTFILTVSRQDDQLFVQATGQGKVEVYPENDHDFFYTVVNAQITFIRDDKAQVIELVLHQHGLDQPAVRID